MNAVLAIIADGGRAIVVIYRGAVNKIISHLLYNFILTALQLVAHIICASVKIELCYHLITFPIFVPSQRLITRNVHELFSYNRGI